MCWHLLGFASATMLLPALLSAGEGDSNVEPPSPAMAGSWNRPLDLYCERNSPTFWAEPLNAWSNLAFVVAGLAGGSLARQLDVRRSEIRLLVTLAVSIGVGSFLFHTFATYWAMWGDLLPIFLYQLWFLWLYLRRIVGWSFEFSLTCVALFFAVMMLAKQLPADFLSLNGSGTYAPAFAMLLALGIYHARSKRQGPLLLLAASGVFLLALTFRTLDNLLCAQVPFGTHFLWHAFNGCLIYLTLHVAIVNWPRQKTAPVPAP